MPPEGCMPALSIQTQVKAFPCDARCSAGEAPGCHPPMPAPWSGRGAHPPPLARGAGLYLGRAGEGPWGSVVSCPGSSAASLARGAEQRWAGDSDADCCLRSDAAGVP